MRGPVRKIKNGHSEAGVKNKLSADLKPAGRFPGKIQYEVEAVRELWDDLRPQRSAQHDRGSHTFVYTREMFLC